MLYLNSYWSLLDQATTHLISHSVWATFPSLPPGPSWNYRIIPTTHPMKEPVHLYYRDTLDCIKLLFNHPLFVRKMDYIPYCLFTSTECDMRVYSKWMSSDGCWEMQVSTCTLPYFCGLTAYHRQNSQLVAYCAALFCCQIKWISPICAAANLRIHYWLI